MSDMIRVAAVAISASFVAACASGANQSLLANESAQPSIAATHVIIRGGASPNTPHGYGPSDLQQAYNLPSSSKGSGQIVAVVDAYDNPNVATDLATYRSTYGLPTAQFTKYNQVGQTKNYPPGNGAWGIDIDLGVETVSASCPLCTIYLVEANSSSVSDLEQAVAEAVKLGAHVVSMGFGGTGFKQSDFNAKGVAYLASSGSGSEVSEPAAFGSVVAVGGTTLTRGGGGDRGWTESEWGNGGCTTFPKPPWQHDKTCAYRLANDVSAVADPSTGVAEYDSYDYSGWIVIGGASVPTPLLAGVFGLAGNATQQDGGRTFWEKAHHRYLFEVLNGRKYVRYSTGAGWGTPDGVGAF